MHIESLDVKQFRGIRNLSLTFQRGLTVLVGENNIGKSSIGLALSRVMLAGASNNNSFQADDRHYGTLGPFTIDAGINLSDEEFNEIVRDPSIPDGIPQQRIPILTLWLARPGEIVHLVFKNSGVDLESGSLRTHQNIIGLRSNDDQSPWATYVLNGQQADWQTRDSLDHILSTHSYDLRV